MAHIDPVGLDKAMDLAPMSATRLAKTVNISIQYMSDIRAGRRTLERNPELRAKLAAALGVPTFWIERREPDTEGAA